MGNTREIKQKGKKGRRKKKIYRCVGEKNIILLKINFVRVTRGKTLPEMKNKKKLEFPVIKFTHNTKNIKIKIKKY